MPELAFTTLDVFTKTRYAGNPLAVVRIPAGQQISTEELQIIAREFNLSETIFLDQGSVGEDGIPEWNVRIFLTKAEINFAGHPTIGAAVYALGTLVDNIKRGRLICRAGPIELDFGNGIAKASIPHSFHVHTQYPFTLDQVCQLQPSLTNVLNTQEAIKTVSPVLGMNFITLELASLGQLASIGPSPKPSPKLDDDWNVGFAGSYFYVLTSFPSREGEAETLAVQTRMIEGSFEDPATGSAACGLSCLIALDRRASRITHFVITQGVEMGRKSDIGVTVTLNQTLDAVEKVELSGSAVKVMDGVLEY